CSVLIRLSEPIPRDLHVLVQGRARVVDAIEGAPTASLTLSSSLFLRLAGGREDAAAAPAGGQPGGGLRPARPPAPKPGVPVLTRPSAGPQVGWSTRPAPPRQAGLPHPPRPAPRHNMPSLQQ